MTTTLALRFPWGRYHATPWNKSANEASVEWPPSPWRILRALYATWKIHCPDLDDDDVLPVLQALAEVPRYRLPEFTMAHTRHYLPGIGHFEGRKSETAKTFDAFVVTARNAEVLVEWPGSLSDGEFSVFQRLAEALSYLGRADAIVDGRAERGTAAAQGSWLAAAADPGEASEPTGRLLAPALPLDVAALAMSPHQVRSARLLQPPSTRWVTYPRPEVAVPSGRRRPRSFTRPTAVRFAVTGRPLPPKYAAVALGDMTRRSVMSKYGGLNDQGVSATLAGKSATRSPLGGRHTHAHYLSFASEGRALDTVVVWAPLGFDEPELLALARKIEFGSKGEDYTGGVSGRRLGVEAFGDVVDVAPEMVGPSAVWFSHTPYAPTRHWKGSTEEQLFSDIAKELEFRGLPRPMRVEQLRGDWLHYRRRRLPPKERINDARRAFGLRVTFDAPIFGPLALGQLSHFGLGLFVPDPG